MPLVTHVIFPVLCFDQRDRIKWAEDPIDFVRMIAVARIAMPQSVVRLAAGRELMSEEAQALCFLAGANSIFVGEKLLTAKNPEEDKDRRLFEKLGIAPMPAHSCPAQK